VIGLPAGTRIWIAAGVTDMRCGFNGLAARVQTVLNEDLFSGHVFVFRGRRGDMIKVLWWSGDGCVCWPSGLNAAASCGRRLPTARYRYPRHSCRCCSKASTGGAPSAPGNYHRPCKPRHPRVNSAHAQPRRPAQRYRCPESIAARTAAGRRRPDGATVSVCPVTP
jgi:hypothetical protein